MLLVGQQYAAISKNRYCRSNNIAVIKNEIAHRKYNIMSHDVMAELCVLIIPTTEKTHATLTASYENKLPPYVSHSHQSNQQACAATPNS